jgi:hypothetical protein
MKVPAMVKGRGHRAVKLWQVASIAILVFGTVAISIGSWTWFQRNKVQNHDQTEANAAQVAVTTRRPLTAMPTRSPPRWHCSRRRV